MSDHLLYHPHQHLLPFLPLLLLSSDAFYRCLVQLLQRSDGFGLPFLSIPHIVFQYSFKLLDLFSKLPTDSILQLQPNLPQRSYFLNNGGNFGIQLLHFGQQFFLFLAFSYVFAQSALDIPLLGLQKLLDSLLQLPLLVAAGAFHIGKHSLHIAFQFGDSQREGLLCIGPKVPILALLSFSSARPSSTFRMVSWKTLLLRLLSASDCSNSSLNLCSSFWSGYLGGGSELALWELKLANLCASRLAFSSKSLLDIFQIAAEQHPTAHNQKHTPHAKTNQLNRPPTMSRSNAKDLYFEDEDEPTQHGTPMMEFKHIDAEAVMRKRQASTVKMEEDRYEVEVYESVAERLSSLSGNQIFRLFIDYESFRKVVANSSKYVAAMSGFSWRLTFLLGECLFMLQNYLISNGLLPPTAILLQVDDITKVASRCVQMVLLGEEGYLPLIDHLRKVYLFSQCDQVIATYLYNFSVKMSKEKEKFHVHVPNQIEEEDTKDKDKNNLSKSRAVAVKLESKIEEPSKENDIQIMVNRKETVPVPEIAPLTPIKPLTDDVKVKLQSTTAKKKNAQQDLKFCKILSESFSLQSCMNQLNQTMGLSPKWKYQSNVIRRMQMIMHRIFTKFDCMKGTRSIIEQFRNNRQRVFQIDRQPLQHRIFQQMARIYLAIANNEPNKKEILSRCIVEVNRLCTE